MATPSTSPPHSQPDPQIQSLPQNPQSPQTLTLETQNQPNDQSDHDQDNQHPDHPFPSPSLSPQLSLSSSSRRPSTTKRKKGSFNKKKQQAVERKVQTLIKTFNPIPFSPSKTLDFDRHEELLKRLGLWDFVHIDFDKKIRTDVIAQLIVTYEQKSRYGYVNEIRIPANRPALSRAMGLPMRREKAASGSQEPVVVDVEEYDCEVSAFLEDLLSNYMLLHDKNWVMPTELVNWTREIKDGHPERVDWAGMVWFMVERELSQGVKLEDCYYASHLQYLIRSQKKEVFDEYEDEVEAREDEGVGMEKAIELDNENVVEKEVHYLIKSREKEVFDEGQNESVVVENEAKYLIKLQEKEAFDEGENEVEVREDEGIKAIEVEEESVVVEEPNVELTLGQDNVEKLEAKDGETKGDMMAVDEIKCKDDVALGGWGLDGKVSTSAHFLQRCNGKEEMDLDADEKSKDDVARDDWSLDGKKATMAQFLQSMNVDEESNFEEEGERSFEEEGERTYIGGEDDDMKLDEEDLEEEEEEEQEEEGEDDEEFGVTPKINGLRSDLDANEIFYGVNEHFDDQSNMGIISPMDEPYSSMGGPSFFGNGKKREMSHDNDLSHNPFSGANKRLRTDGSSSKSSDFDFCMDQIQLWVGKAREMYAAKEKEVEHFSNNQQMLMNEVQQRNSVIEHLHKTKYEDLRKKDEEIDRLDRELYVMGNLINGYRDALKATRKDFSEYRDKCQLPEEPIYKEVGPGGLVLSTMEIERNRLKREEEDRVNRVIVEQNINSFEEECVVTFKGHLNQIQVMENKLLDQEKKFSEIKGGFAKRKVPEAMDSATPVEVDSATPVEVDSATPVE